jgi:hypothetical protein
MTPAFRRVTIGFFLELLVCPPLCLLREIKKGDTA